MAGASLSLRGAPAWAGRARRSHEILSSLLPPQRGQAQAGPQPWTDVEKLRRVSYSHEGGQGAGPKVAPVEVSRAVPVSLTPACPQLLGPSACGPEFWPTLCLTWATSGPTLAVSHATPSQGETPPLQMQGVRTLGRSLPSGPV